MSSNLPNLKDIENVIRAIRKTDLPRIVLFADMINRYVSIKLKDQVDWLRINTLIFLTTMGGKLTFSQLAQLMLRPNHSITRLIDSLEKDGLVVRERTSKDRRAIYVRVTSDGLAFIMRSLREFSMTEKELISCLNKDEVEVLRNSIRQLRLRVIEKTTRETDAFSHYYRSIIYKRLGKKAEAKAARQTFMKLLRDKSK